ncbi:MAG: hypothetical protein QW343_02960 [Candidatus Norongarragalinales archaeon]
MNLGEYRLKQKFVGVTHKGKTIIFHIYEKPGANRLEPRWWLSAKLPRGKEIAALGVKRAPKLFPWQFHFSHYFKATQSKTGAGLALIAMGLLIAAKNNAPGMYLHQVDSGLLEKLVKEMNATPTTTAVSGEGEYPAAYWTRKVLSKPTKVRQRWHNFLPRKSKKPQG